MATNTGGQCDRSGRSSPGIIHFAFLLGLLILPLTLNAAPIALDEGAQACLNCHGTAGMTMTLGDRSTLSVYVDGTGFADSVHGSLGCGGCHSDVLPDKHPSEKFASAKQLRAKLAAACRGCHGNDQLMANPLHQRVVSRENAPPCSDCHQAHKIRKAGKGKGKAGAGISQYCLTCHSRELTRSINGQKISLTLDEDWIRGSVHKNHECTDCHSGYTREFHPPPQKMESIRQLSKGIAETCKRCHLNKAVQYSDSIHGTGSSSGVQNAPVCTDCHGAHRVGPPALAETLEGVPCRKCHAAAFAAYRTSVHGVRKSEGAGNPPLCAGCHQAHDVKAATTSLSPKERCVVCHKTYAASHQQWLPNPAAHLEMVACTACHVPIDRKRSIYLRLTDGESGKLLGTGDIKTLLEAHGAERGKIAPRDLWWLFQRLNQGRTVKVAVAVSMNDPVTSHEITVKKAALKQCDRCHTADSAFFDTVSVTTAGPDGREVLYNADPAILTSAYGVLLLKRFYVMSGTRITAMDYFGLVVILGGLAFPVLHGGARFLVNRLRKDRTQRSEGRR